MNTEFFSFVSSLDLDLIISSTCGFVPLNSVKIPQVLANTHRLLADAVISLRYTPQIKIEL